MSGQRAFVEGLAFWSPELPGWDVARAAFRGGPETNQAKPAARPSPELLPAAERRRAPDTVAIALEVATCAMAESGRDPRELQSVFSSTHGDLAVTDYMCATLVRAPLLISPTKFHNSVHNAASGYWGIATGCQQASTAISAFGCSFAAGLLEALTQCAADRRPVLLVGYDIAAVGPLASTNESRDLLAVALVLAPEPSRRMLCSFEWALAAGPSARMAPRSRAAASLEANAMSDALPLFEALARDDVGMLAMPVAPRLTLSVTLDDFSTGLSSPKPTPPLPPRV